VAPDDVYREAFALARRLAAGAPLAQRAAKRAVIAALDGEVKAGLEAERAEFAALFGTEDQKIGMRSFIENGPGKAEFTGR
jgi:enoyl-CoA hydratase/carnithine racemase